MDIFVQLICVHGASDDLPEHTNYALETSVSFISNSARSNSSNCFTFDPLAATDLNWKSRERMGRDTSASGMLVSGLAVGKARHVAH